MILAIDPGNERSAYVLLEDVSLRPLEFGILPNDELLEKGYEMFVDSEIAKDTVIEMVASYGMSVGKEVFETVFWIGRFYEKFNVYPRCRSMTRMFRMEVKMNICHQARAKDANIVRALIDRFATHDFKSGKGTKSNPDWFYGFKDDIWQAYALGVTFADTRAVEESA